MFQSNGRMKLTGAVDQLERAGTSAGHFETGIIDAETVAR